ncbi:aminoglycoside phosphotransferase family protein [Streptomyces sp. NPDC047023]|uniref:aminoglycoside phosphotransferase family protein n=1 Tax=Streptomyces sp. NPDC047023 TaxID=3155139 RepID=UPI0033EABF07
MSVRDASHDWDRSRVWDLEGEQGVHHHLKVSPSRKFFTRESLAYRHVVPALGHARAPHLIDSLAQDLAMLLTAVPGTPAKQLGLGRAEWRAVHQQVGALCARLHEAGELERGDRAEAEASLNAAADAAEKYLTRTGDRLTQDEQRLIRDHAARLRRVGPVPVGYIHGDNQPRNWLWSEHGLALVDFERTRPAALVQDLVILAMASFTSTGSGSTSVTRPLSVTAGLFELSVKSPENDPWQRSWAECSGPWKRSCSGSRSCCSRRSQPSRCCR